MKNLFIKCVVAALASAVSVCASGQTTLTLQDRMRYAISNSTKVRIQQAAIGDAQIDRRDAALKLFTPLEFQTANNNYLKAQADEMNSLFKYLIKQAVVKYYNGEAYIDQ